MNNNTGAFFLNHKPRLIKTYSQLGSIIFTNTKTD